MSDLPPELVEKLARASYDDGAFCGLCGYEGWSTCLDCRQCNIRYVKAWLTALITHAGPDATHIDLSTWEGVRAVKVDSMRRESHRNGSYVYYEIIPLFTIDPTEAP